MNTPTRRKKKSDAVLTVRVPILVSEEQYKRLVDTAAARKCSVGALIRSLIDELKED